MVNIHVPFTWFRSLGGSLKNFQVTLKNCDLDLVLCDFIFFIFDLDFDLDLVFIVFILHSFNLYFDLMKDIFIVKVFSSYNRTFSNLSEVVHLVIVVDKILVTIASLSVAVSANSRAETNSAISSQLVGAWRT